ncbi:membrane protein [Herbaspirillum rubrisubalbicans]|uniref:Membrane protein n=2 Tax=Herbaspirillum rubrisubalbicans TaxID=80842 RepID=A0ABX9BU94_9BURK|nr:membrane protein [Herbaspirillum rubrisubalbicans]
MRQFITRLHAAAKRLKRDIVTLMFIAKDSSAPWMPKLLAMVIAAYALSPIDLIPDFIPVLGYLDDLIIVPLGIWICLRLTPTSTVERNRRLAEAWLEEKNQKPRSYVGLGIILLIWSALLWYLFAVITS